MVQYYTHFMYHHRQHRCRSRCRRSHSSHSHRHCHYNNSEAYFNFRQGESPSCAPLLEELLHWPCLKPQQHSPGDKCTITHARCLFLLAFYHLSLHDEVAVVRQVSRATRLVIPWPRLCMMAARLTTSRIQLQL